MHGAILSKVRIVSPNKIKPTLSIRENRDRGAINNQSIPATSFCRRARFSVGWRLAPYPTCEQHIPSITPKTRKVLAITPLRSGDKQLAQLVKLVANLRRLFELQVLRVLHHLPFQLVNLLLKRLRREGDRIRLNR